MLHPQSLLQQLQLQQEQQQEQQQRLPVLNVLKQIACQDTASQVDIGKWNGVETLLSIIEDSGSDGSEERVASLYVLLRITLLSMFMTCIRKRDINAFKNRK